MTDRERALLINKAMPGGALSAHPFGGVLDGLAYTVSFQRARAWEEVLKLHIRPKPWWMPMLVWKRLISLVLIQSQDIISRAYDPEAGKQK